MREARMARTRTAAASAILPMPLATSFVELLRGLWRDVSDPYRPEQHYMRGPGPACRAKHDAVQSPTR